NVFETDISFTPDQIEKRKRRADGQIELAEDKRSTQIYNGQHTEPRPFGFIPAEE
ncbi:Uncharacterized protein APZ42_002267, partial [Daphnia magna]